MEYIWPHGKSGLKAPARIEDRAPVPRPRARRRCGASAPLDGIVLGTRPGLVQAGPISLPIPYIYTYTYTIPIPILCLYLHYTYTYNSPIPVFAGVFARSPEGLSDLRGPRHLPPPPSSEVPRARTSDRDRYYSDEYECYYYIHVRLL